MGGTGAPEDSLGFGRVLLLVPLSLDPICAVGFVCELGSHFTILSTRQKIKERTDGQMDRETDLQFKGVCLGPRPAAQPRLLLLTAPLFLEGPGSFRSPWRRCRCPSEVLIPTGHFCTDPVSSSVPPKDQLVLDRTFQEPSSCKLGCEEPRAAWGTREGLQSDPGGGKQGLEPLPRALDFTLKTSHPATAPQPLPGLPSTRPWAQPALSTAGVTRAGPPGQMGKVVVWRGQEARPAPSARLAELGDHELAGGLARC